MFRRILLTTVSAAAMFAAGTAFAAERSSAQPCSCCADGSNHEVDHPIHEGQRISTQRTSGAAERASKDDADRVAAGNSGGRG